MSKNIKTSEALFERSKKIVPGGVHSPVRAFKGVGGTPRFIKEAKGAYLIDVDGNRYLDFCQSWGPLLYGHQDAEVAEAVKMAMTRGWSFGAAEPYSLELAEFVTARIPWLEKVRFVNSGTEAVMSALRVARGATGRSKVLKFDGCYHGHVDSLLVRAGSGLAEMASPDSAGVSAAVAAETLVCPLNDETTLEQMMAVHGSEIAAIIVEPLPANNGLLIQTDAFLKKIEALCKKYGSALIFDEVISGFRVAFGGMAEKLGIRPDLVCYGKIIGGGFPVGAYGGKASMMDLVAPLGPVYQAGTLSANPVAMSAGLAMVQKIHRTQPYAALSAATDGFSREAEALSAKYSRFPAKMQSYGSLFWMICGHTGDVPVRAISEIPGDQKALFAKFFHGLLERGVYLAPSGYEVGFVSTVHTPSEFGFVLEKIEEVYKAW